MSLMMLNDEIPDIISVTDGTVIGQYRACTGWNLKMKNTEKYGMPFLEKMKA